MFPVVRKKYKHINLGEGYKDWIFNDINLAEGLALLQEVQKLNVTQRINELKAAFCY